MRRWWRSVKARREVSRAAMQRELDWSIGEAGIWRDRYWAEVRENNRLLDEMASIGDALGRIQTQVMEVTES